MSALRASLFSLVLLVLLTPLAGAQAAGTQPATRPPRQAASQKKHPRVAPGKDCSDCHKKQYAEWESGPHGVNQVKCLVCHGSIEEGFTTKPAVSRCEGCHPEIVDQAKTDPFMRGKNCFTCHPPHGLKPHPRAASGGE